MFTVDVFLKILLDILSPGFFKKKYMTDSVFNAEFQMHNAILKVIFHIGWSKM